MKKFNLKTFVGQEVDRYKARRPKPFPGRFPTRIVAKVEIGDKVIFSYCGKIAPVPAEAFEAAVNKAAQAARNERKPYRFALAEFDRAGLIAMQTSYYVLYGYAQMNSLLWNYYHPWESYNRPTKNPFKKRVAGHYVYSPMDEVPLDKIRDYHDYCHKMEKML